MLQCPRCSYPLTVVRHPHKPIEVDECKRCGGVFLEPNEAIEYLGPLADPNVWMQSDDVEHLGPDKLICPHDGTIMHGYVLASETEGVQLDACPTCGGLWFDDREQHKLFRILREKREKEKDKPPPEDQEPSLWSYIFQILTNLPIEGYHPVKRTPVILYILIGLVLVGFGIEYVMILQKADMKAFIQAYACIPAKVLKGEGYLGLFTCMFLHSGWVHLLSNLYFLYVFGDNVEDALGKTRFLVLYFGAGLLASLAQVYFTTTPQIGMIGASGAIAGVMGAYLILFPKVDIWVVIMFFRFRVKAWMYLLFWVGIQVVMWTFIDRSKSTGGVAWLAHIGGFVGGLVLSYIMLQLFTRVKVRTGRIRAVS